MPANLTPQYHQAEEAYRRAGTPQEELACLQQMMRELPKHKGTDHLQAELKHRISAARKEIERLANAPRRATGLRLPRQGAGRVVILGAPNSGKSQLLAALTNATPLVADYPFSTRELQVGMMPWRDVAIQLVDTPPITADVLDPQLQGVIRGADLVLLLAEMASDLGGAECEAVCERLRRTRTHLGVRSYLDRNDLGRSVTATRLVLTKMDCDIAILRRDLWREQLDWDLPVSEVSAVSGAGLDLLKDAIAASLQIVRIYTKQPHQKEPDRTSPFTLRHGETVARVAELVHQDFAARLKGARVWREGQSNPILVKADFVLEDGDIVELQV